jgi:hypothetical protein
MKYLLFSLIIILVGTDTFAAVVLDQSHNAVSNFNASTNGNSTEIAQTFTVGIAGTLDHIDVVMYQLGSSFPTNADPKLSVYNTTAGVPSGVPLTTVQFPRAQVPVIGSPNFVTFDVSAAGIPVSVGDVFAFGVSTLSNPNSYFLTVDPSGVGNYSGGAAYARTLPAQPWQIDQPPQDLLFRTFVNTVPEPSTCVLAAIGFLICLTRRRMGGRSGI